MLDFNLKDFKRKFLNMFDGYFYGYFDLINVSFVLISILCIIFLENLVFF